MQLTRLITLIVAVIGAASLQVANAGKEADLPDTFAPCLLPENECTAKGGPGVKMCLRGMDPGGFYAAVRAFGAMLG
jgi:hypothetical protein